MKRSPERSQGHEPNQHERSEQRPDRPCASTLQLEKPQKDYQGRGNDGLLKRRRGDREALECAQHGHGGRNDSVAVEKSATGETNECDERGAPAV